ncbi:hypothetical protein GOV07_03540 [Candidatus Woesearchaeota archaeon]|nr:hypothetical protein [Candidatus Woesearchaeota archaeon]
MSREKSRHQTFNPQYECMREPEEDDFFKEVVQNSLNATEYLNRLVML